MGLVRDANEDSYLTRVSERGGLFLVADGIGGMAHGEVVSGMLRDSYDRWWQDRFLPAERTMAFQTAIFQSYALYPHMTVYENMAFPLTLRKVPKDEIDRRVKEAAEILDIT